MRTPTRLACSATGLALAIGAGLARCPAAEPNLAPESPPAPLANARWDSATARHLLWRAGLGGPPEEVERLRAMGHEQAVRSLVDFQRQPDVAFAPPPALPRPPRPEEMARLDEQRRRQLVRERMRQERAHMDEVRAWWVRRMIETRRPLEERMVLFWHGHFTSGARTVRDSQAMLEQNQLFRSHAVGNFGRLLHAVVHDPAMLRYLDNDRNSKQHPNENLARELLELFCMGEGHYTERDIQEAARALTGNHIDRQTGRFRFASKAHDHGDKTIFGQTGNFGGDQLVELILAQPATARWLARRLFVYFAHENPDEATVEHLAGVLREHNYELAPMLTTLFRMADYYGPRSAGKQIKSPVQWVVGSVRALGIGDADGRALAAAMRDMGQDLFEPPNVKGWDGGRAWINSNWLLARHRFAVKMIAISSEPRPSNGAKSADVPQNRKAGRSERPAGRFNAVEWCQTRKLFSPHDIVDRLASTLLAVPLAPGERAELVGSLGSLPPSGEWQQASRDIQARLGKMLLLIMTMPAFQLT